MRTGKVPGPEVVLIYVHRVLRECARVLNGQMRETRVSWRAERCVRKLEFVGKNAKSIEAAIWQSRATTTRGSVFKGKDVTNLTCGLSHLTSNHIERHISLTPTPSELSLHET